MTPRLVGSWIYTNNFKNLYNLYNLLESLGLITWDGSGWLTHGSTLQVSKPSDSNKFYKILKLFVYIHDPTSWGGHNLDLGIWSRLSQVICTLLKQVKPSQGNSKWITGLGNFPWTSVFLCSSTTDQANINFHWDTAQNLLQCLDLVELHGWPYVPELCASLDHMWGDFVLNIFTINQNHFERS